MIHIALGKGNPERPNGVNKVVFELALHQFMNGHNVSLWGITKTLEVNFPPRPFKTRLFQDLRNKFAVSDELKQAIANADKEAIFHLHGGFLPQMYRVARLLKKHHLRYIYTPHGAFNTVAMKRSGFKKKVYIFLFERTIVRWANFVHLIGKSEVDGTQQVFGEEVKTRLIPNGQKVYLNVPEHTPNALRKIHFGFIGRLDVHTKGLDILLDGFARFQQKSPFAAVLHIVGGGNGQEEFSRMVEARNLQDNVVMHGAVFGEAKDELLKRFDFFCLTSRNEGLPGVVLEALSLGKPCIVSPETNMGDFIRTYKAGFCLDENNEISLEQSLLDAAQLVSEDRYSLASKNAVHLIQKEFRWSDISSRLIEACYEA